MVQVSYNFLMNTKLFNALAAVGTLAGVVVASGSANAASFSVTASIASQATDIIDAPLSVQQFDSSLGLLDSVDLEFISNVTGSATVTNTGASPANVKFQLGSTVTLVDALNNQQLLSVNPTKTGSSFAVPVGQTVTASPLQATDSITQNFTDNLFLQSFTGNGNRSFLFSAIAESGVFGSGNVSSQVSTFADGFLKVTYNYSDKPPTTIPEPSTLLGIGLIAGFGLLSQRKKSWLKFSKS